MKDPLDLTDDEEDDPESSEIRKVLAEMSGEIDGSTTDGTDVFENPGQGRFTPGSGGGVDEQHSADQKFAALDTSLIGSLRRKLVDTQIQLSRARCVDRQSAEQHCRFLPSRPIHTLRCSHCAGRCKLVEHAGRRGRDILGVSANMRATCATSASGNAHALTAPPPPPVVDGALSGLPAVRKRAIMSTRSTATFMSHRETR